MEGNSTDLLCQLGCQVTFISPCEGAAKVLSREMTKRWRGGGQNIRGNRLIRII